MKVILRKLALSLSLAFGATGTLTAEQVFLQCELPGQDQREWVQPSIVLAFETGEAKALVADGINIYYIEIPIWAEKRENRQSNFAELENCRNQ